MLVGTSSLDTAGIATYSTVLPSGVHSVSAMYAGTIAFGQSTSQNLQQIVLTPTTTTITAGSVTNWTQGISLGFSIQVLPVSGTNAVSGLVDVYVGSTHLGTATIMSGSGVFNTSALPVGLDQVTAAFEGNTLFASSTSSPVAVTIDSANPVATTTTLTPSATAISAGGSINLVATVSPASGTTTPSGTVTFFDGGAQLGTASLSNGSASLTTHALAAGSHQLIASYSGGSNFSGSTSAAVVVTAAAATPVSTTTVLTPSSAQVAQGSTVTLSATVTPASGSTTPTGTVNFYTGTTLLGSAQLSNGVAVLSTTALPVGTDSLTAQYGGSSSFAVSTSAAASVTVVVPDFTMVASPSAITVKRGSTAVSKITINPENGFSQTVTFTCSGLPSGSVCSFGTPVQNADGTSSVSLSISTAATTAALDSDKRSGAPLLALLPSEQHAEVKQFPCEISVPVPYEVTDIVIAVPMARRAEVIIKMVCGQVFAGYIPGTHEFI